MVALKDIEKHTLPLSLLKKQWKNLLPTLIVCVLTVKLQAQAAVGSAIDSAIISAVPARCIGFNTAVSARVSALAVYNRNPDTFYIGSAGGGVLKTIDGGLKFYFVFDKYGSSNIGALAVSQKDPNLVWVGTGEPWQRNSVGRGSGVYKSVDGGKNWLHMGLEKTNTIAKIVIHPINNNIIFVAAMGSAWGYGKDRGIYKTKDGGKTWKKVLYLNDRSSGVEVIIDPKNPKNMLAALWDHIHRPYGWFESSSGSGIYRSTDGGETWARITNGLPTERVGRIALDYFPQNPKYVAALIQNSNPVKWVYTSEDGGKTWQSKRAIHVRNIKDRKDTVPDNINNGNLIWGRPYYNWFVKYHPTDRNVFYHSIHHYTVDGGNTWIGDGHDDHGLWIDPLNIEHQIAISDIGVEQRKGSNLITPRSPPISMIYGIGYDMRKLYWVMANMQDQFGAASPTQSIFGSITDADYLGTQADEGGKPMSDPNDWTKFYSSTRNLYLVSKNLISGKSSGNPIQKKISYSDTLSFNKYLEQSRRFRSNWNPGFSISPWNSQIIYYGGNFLFRTSDAGKNWDTISPDLTHNRIDWQVPDDGALYHGDGGLGDDNASRQYQTITVVYESSLRKDMIWVGTDCGFVQLTMNGGKTWENLTSNIGVPEYCWVSHIYPSKFSEARAYITFDNHRNNDNSTYVFVTDDYGKSWKKITGNLPAHEACFVIKEGLKNPDLLYLGTEFGLWISLNRGITWVRYRDFQYNNLGLDKDFIGSESSFFPTVAVRDLEIHPRELDLIVGTHGRGIWILPTRALEEMSAENRSKEVHFATIGNIYSFNRLERKEPYNPYPVVQNTQPGTYISYYLKQDHKEEIKFSIFEQIGVSSGKETTRLVEEFTRHAKKGLNMFLWKPTEMPDPGNYFVIFKINGKEYRQTFKVEDVTGELYPCRDEFGR